MKKYLSNFQKIIFIGAILIFTLSMLPILYLSFYAAPSGDDYGYSILTHAAWLETGSLWAVIKAGFVTVRKFYVGWNGDWFTTFLFSLMPEIFKPGIVWVGIFVITAFFIWGNFFFAKEMLNHQLGMAGKYGITLTCILLFLDYQLIPSTAIGMYWYVGAMHYMMPHAAVLVAIALAFRYNRTGKWMNIWWSVAAAIAVGGSSYFSSLLLFMVYAVLLCITVPKKKRNLWLLLPFFCCLTGFVIQCISPGNKVRAGESFGLSGELVVQTILESLRRSIVELIYYAKERVLIYVALLLFAAIGWGALRSAGKAVVTVRYPVLFTVFMYGCYSGMYAPEIYAGVDVSLGPATIEYFTFLLTAGATILYWEAWILQHGKSKNEKKEIAVWSVALIVVGLISLVNHSWISNLTDVRIYKYVASGQAADFKEQIRMQREVLLDDSIQEAYIVPANSDQGPLMHMPVTNDENAFTNQVLAGFYGKTKVLVIED